MLKSDNLLSIRTPRQQVAEELSSDYMFENDRYSELCTEADEMSPRQRWYKVQSLRKRIDSIEECEAEGRENVSSVIKISLGLGIACFAIKYGLKLDVPTVGINIAGGVSIVGGVAVGAVYKYQASRDTSIIDLEAEQRIFER